MVVNKSRLKEVATPLNESARRRMMERKADRYWKAASSAIAAKVRRQLKITDTSRVKLAEILGVTPANITRYLNGTTNFELRTLVELERALGIEIINKDVIPTKCQTPVILNIEYTVSSGEFSSQSFDHHNKSLIGEYYA